MPRPKKSSVSKSSRKFPWVLRVVFLLGVILVILSLLYHVQQAVQLSFYNNTPLPAMTQHDVPRAVEIRIPKVDIDLPVIETVIVNDTWQIADNGISHLAISGRPGENTTIIMYGHNTDDRFGPIRWLSIGDTITLINTQNKTFAYKIAKITTVDPSNTKILTSQKGATLILYTCTGFADLQRYVIIAKPKN